MGLSVFGDAHYMKEALKEAEKAMEEGEVPVGAVVVCKNKIISRAHNQTERLTDPTAHAEMLAITAAFNNLGGKYLEDCTVYVTLEPCTMCAGAMFWARPGKIIYAARDEKRGYEKWGAGVLHPKTKVEYGIMESESSALLNAFFSALRDKRIH